MNAEEKKAAFKANLARICAERHLSLRKIASDCGFDEAGYCWLRRVASKGLSRLQANNVEKVRLLEKYLAKQMGWTSRPEFKSLQKQWGRDNTPSMLWNTDLIEQLNVQSECQNDSLDDKNAKLAFDFLLETQKYEYLKDLVRDLFLKHQQSKELADQEEKNPDFEER